MFFAAAKLAVDFVVACIQEDGAAHRSMLRRARDDEEIVPGRMAEPPASRRSPVAVAEA